MAAHQTNLEAVKELILDEHKLVTYISLSKELCIHVNEAKSLLTETIQDIRKAKPETDLSVSYVISGLLNDNSGCVTVCSDINIEALKKTFKVIFYQHVYCVRLGLIPVDNLALTAINKFGDLPLCTGLIQANTCIKRTNDEIGNLKSKNQVGLNALLSAQQHPNHKVEVKKQDVKKEDVKTGFKETFSKAKTPSPKKNLSNSNKIVTKTNSTKTAAKGIAGFFSKVNSDSSKVIKAIVQDPDIKVEKDVKIEQTSSDSNKSSKAVNGSLNHVKDKENHDKTLIKMKKNAKVDKKRKRLLHVSDSESEPEESDPFSNEMDVNCESEDEIPPTPTINTVKITSGIINPKKRRKLVDRTYTDEDGYILTKKEEVYESFSDNEEEVKDNVNLMKVDVKHEKEEGIVQVKQNKTEPSPKENKSKKKKSPPQKGKQPTINNFFKKV